jgi:hypothetical protein
MAHVKQQIWQRRFLAYKIISFSRQLHRVAAFLGPEEFHKLPHQLHDCRFVSTRPTMFRVISE